jgi:antitoxin (DNA-binding transcriptional repressor) of toxin-antitoxin stability system
MAAPTTDKAVTIVVSALNARANFGRLLDRVSDGRHSLVIEKRGTPAAHQEQQPRRRTLTPPGRVQRP